jgi:Kef-type K+ transport system membrane component KefB
LLIGEFNQRWNFFHDGELEVLRFFGELGIIALLFRVGLESNLDKLIRQLRRASVVWLCNISASGLLGFVTAYWGLNLGLIASLFIGVAMTATSIGIAVSVWKDANALDSDDGELLVDVAEMDDISAVVLMSLLFVVVPVLHLNPDANVMPLMGLTIAGFGVKAFLFGTFCFYFSRNIEKPMTQFFERLEPAPDPTIMVVGVGIIIAAMAGLLGFSVAIGSFFAGLLFSRDPEAVKLEASFITIYEFFVPFFFFGIGLSIHLETLPTALGLGSLLLTVAVLGKLIGVIGPVWPTAGKTSAMLLGISMVPRAEILMVVMQHGQQLGDWAVPPHVFSAMVLVSAATSIGVPLVLRPMLRSSYCSYVTPER